MNVAVSWESEMRFRAEAGFLRLVVETDGTASSKWYILDSRYFSYPIIARGLCSSIGAALIEAEKAALAVLARSSAENVPNPIESEMGVGLVKDPVCDVRAA